MASSRKNANTSERERVMVVIGDSTLSDCDWISATRAGMPGNDYFVGMKTRTPSARNAMETKNPGVFSRSMNRMNQYRPIANQSISAIKVGMNGVYYRNRRIAATGRPDSS